MSNINDALEILLNEEDPVIYDYETSGFTFITIDYTGGSYITIPIEMLIDETSSETMLSLVGHTQRTLNINKKNCKNHLWSEMIINQINQTISENQQVGVWSCSLEGDSLQDALDLNGKVSFQFVLNIPKALEATGMAELLKAGVESFKSTVGRINRFIHKCEISEVALDFDDVFPDKKVQISYHPKFLDILNNPNGNE